MPPPRPPPAGDIRRDESPSRGSANRFALPGKFARQCIHSADPLRQTIHTMNDTTTSQGAVLKSLEMLGESGLIAARRIADTLYLLANAVAGIFTIRRGAWFYLRQLTLQQIYFTAVQSIGMIAFVGAALGILTMLPLYAFRVSELDLLVRVMNMVLFHQVTPLVTALVVIGRSGTAITAEVGELQVNQTIETLITLGIEPHQFLVLPRLFGVTLALLLLTFWANTAAVLGAALFSTIYHEIPFAVFVLRTIEGLRSVNVLAGTSLVVLYGIIIALVHSSFGFRARSSLDTPRRLPQSFVASSALSVLVTVLVSAALYA